MEADAGLLDRVLANVLENALRHSPGRQEVVVRAAATQDTVQVRVVDRGAGVPDTAKEFIFAPSSGTAMPPGTGVGLGLAVAKGLVEAMNGTITAEDTPEGGLTIVIELRAARPRWSAQAQRAEAVQQTQTTEPATAGQAPAAAPPAADRIAP